MDKAGGVVPDMRDCAWAEKARLDDRLFAEIKKIRRQDGTPQVADPKAFMDELVKYRSDMCGLTMTSGGQMDLLTYDECFMDMTIDLTKFVDGVIRDSENHRRQRRMRRCTCIFW